MNKPSSGRSRSAPHVAKGGGTCTSELNKTASLGIQAKLSGSS